MAQSPGSHPLIETLSSIDPLLGLTHVFVRDRESRIVYWGAGAERLYGWTAHLAIGKISHELLKTVFPIPLAQIEHIVADVGYWQGNLTHTTSSGEVKRVASYWARYHHPSEPDYCILEDNHDVTQLFELARELRKAINTRDGFLATVIHDLRTPLQAVQVAAQVAQQSLTKNQEQSRRNMERVVNGARSMAALLQRLVDSIRIDSGQLEVESHSVDMVAVVRSAVDLMRPLAEANRIEVRTNLPAVSLNVLGDAERLEESVRNLLGNAIKFTYKDGHIDLILVGNGDVIELKVMDDGEGIDPVFMPRLFEPMAKGEHDGRNHTGLGLGLFITKNVIEQHGGSISASSEGKGRGATFTISLPAISVGTPA